MTISSVTTSLLRAVHVRHGRRTPPRPTDGGVTSYGAGYLLPCPYDVVVPTGSAQSSLAAKVSQDSTVPSW